MIKRILVIEVCISLILVVEFSAGLYKDRQLNIIFLAVQEDYDTRLGQLQMDIVHLRSAKQQLEHELGCLRVDHDHSQSDMEAMENRHRCVMRSLALLKQKLQKLSQPKIITPMGAMDGELWHIKSH